MSRWPWILAGAGALALLAWGGARVVISARMRGPRWDYLVPDLKVKAMELLAAAEREGLSVVFWEGWRTEEDQRGKMAAGVSWVADPLSSYHCWGRAIDVTFRNAAGLPEWPDPTDPANLARWIRLGELGEALGLTWGGRWRRFDGAHFQLPDPAPDELLAAWGRDPLSYLRAEGVAVA